MTLKYAIYRCLYGEDFIEESIKSISPYVDKIFIIWTDKVLGGVQSCVYKGETIEYPKKFDNVVEKAKQSSDKVIAIEDYVSNNLNQFTHIVNDLILPGWVKPNTFIIPEIDHVFKEEEIKKAIWDFDQEDEICASMNQIELWRTPEFRIPHRERVSTMFWNADKFKTMPTTGRQAEPYRKPYKRLAASTHNMGFCVSKESMYWKHMTAIGFSQAIGDTPPRENWLEDTWQNWDFNSNNKNLEISQGYEHLIPQAYPYNTEDLPEVIKDRYGYEC